jgi:fructokinase
MSQFIGIEGGGTKFVCAYGSGPDDLHNRVVIKTQSPEKTMQEVIEYIHDVRKKTEIAAIGFSIFGPLDLDKTSTTYGYVLPTVKEEWLLGFDCVGALKQQFHLPIGFDTDVNAAALGEHRWGAAQGFDDFLYITVGTGIGGGAMVNGKMLHGAMHPEMGHIMVTQDRAEDPFAGICVYHKNCLEGLASGPAMKARWHVDSALDLPQDHPSWDLEAKYIGAALADYTLMLAPKRIILGGGVMRQKHLMPKIRAQMVKALAGFINNKTVNDVESYVVSPGVGENSGVLGSIALAQFALDGK